MISFVENVLFLKASTLSSVLISIFRLSLMVSTFCISRSSYSDITRFYGTKSDSFNRELVSSSIISLHKRSSIVGASLIVHLAQKGGSVTKNCQFSLYFQIIMLGLGRITLSPSLQAISQILEINFLKPSIVSQTWFCSSSAHKKINFELRYLARPLV